MAEFAYLIALACVPIGLFLPGILDARAYQRRAHGRIRR